MAQAAAPVALSELQEETRMERESRASAVDSAGARARWIWLEASGRAGEHQPMPAESALGGGDGWVWWWG